MKKYKLNIMINGRPTTSKLFKTRDAAEKYMSKVFNDNDIQTEYKVKKIRNHWQEFHKDGRTFATIYNTEKIEQYCACGQ